MSDSSSVTKKVRCGAGLEDIPRGLPLHAKELQKRRAVPVSAGSLALTCIAIELGPGNSILGPNPSLTLVHPLSLVFVYKLFGFGQVLDGLYFGSLAVLPRFAGTANL